MKALCIGEVLWDIIRGREHLGGAPLNGAAHLARQGCEASVITRVGHDRRGQTALREMKQLGVDITLVQTDLIHPTGWAKVALTAEGVPTFSFPDNPAYNFIEFNGLARRLADTRFDAICFGTLVQKGEVAHTTLQKILQSVRAREILYDVNIRLAFYPKEILQESLNRSTIVKLNEDEAPLIAERLYGKRLSEKQLVDRLMKEFPVRVVCITKGGKGCVVYSAGKSRRYPGQAIRVADTVGAGDAFSAAFLNHYCRTGDPFEAARRGNLLGAYVASRRGAIPTYTKRIQAMLEQ